MVSPGRKAKWVTGTALLAAAGLAVAWAIHLRANGLPYQDHFARRSLEGWTSYGGNWQVADGAVTNESNESGSRLVTGSERLTDFRLDAEVRLTNTYGDAGLVFRMTESEEGTNAFYGYYAGMRFPNMLILARMDYGFQPLRTLKLPEAVQPGRWYHLSVQAKGCALSVQARAEDGTVLAHTDAVDRTECQAHGNFGLRSFAAGGSWRHVAVQPIH